MPRWFRGPALLVVIAAADGLIAPILPASLGYELKVKGLPGWGPTETPPGRRWAGGSAGSWCLRGARGGGGDEAQGGSAMTKLEERIGVKFSDGGLLRQACTHRSVVEQSLQSNERLEFLGDAVLGMVVADHLYRTNEGLLEGRLSELRKAVVSTEALARVGREQGLGEFILMAANEVATGGRNKDNALADLVESVIAAVYLDRGLEEARSLVQRWLGAMIEKAVASPVSSDHKTRLQEVLIKLHLGDPSYHTVRTGPAHNSKFTAHVTGSWGARLGWGEGKSKKAAEQAAAGYTLEILEGMEAHEIDALKAKAGGA